MFDGAVLAGGIHALKNQQYGPGILRVKLFLQIAQPVAVRRDYLVGGLLVEIALLVRLVKLEMEFLRAIDAEWIHILFQFRASALPFFAMVAPISKEKLHAGAVIRQSSIDHLGATRDGRQAETDSSSWCHE